MLSVSIHRFFSFFFSKTYHIVWECTLSHNTSDIHKLLPEPHTLRSLFKVSKLNKLYFAWSTHFPWLTFTEFNMINNVLSHWFGGGLCSTTDIISHRMTTCILRCSVHALDPIQSLVVAWGRKRTSRGCLETTFWGLQLSCHCDVSCRSARKENKQQFMQTLLDKLFIPCYLSC